KRALWASSVVVAGSPSQARNSGRTTAAGGAPARSASEIPWTACAAGDIGRPGWTSCWKRPDSRPGASKRTAPTSTIRSVAANSPVVSRSNATRDRAGGPGAGWVIGPTPSTSLLVEDLLRDLPLADLAPLPAVGPHRRVQVLLGHADRAEPDLGLAVPR